MLFDLLNRHTRPPVPESTIDTRSRVEVCPPSLQPQAGLGRFTTWLRDLLRHGAPFDTPPLLQENANKLAAVREARGDFLRLLEDIRSPEADSLRCVISDSQSLRELWHLRSKVFGLVAVRFSQHEAETRLERLNGHFPTRAPRSGMAPFDVMSALDKK